ncbi:MAG: ABC transporter substrate-binding protein [Phycisphaerae bacterium]
MRGVYFKNGLLAIAIAAMVGYLFVPLKSRWTPPKPDDVVIQLWHPWSGVYADSLNEVIAEFNRTHPGIVARPLFIPSSAGDKTKFYISVAGNVPPDVAMVDGTEVATWAHMGVLQPLDERLADAGMEEADFWGPSWEQCRYRNKTWAVSIVADPNFALVWNKQLFREAGLDPDKPPKTFDQLVAYCDKLVKYDRTGRIERLGIMPAFVYSDANAIFTYGWAFGGEFYDDAAQQFTPDHPKVLEAMHWLLFMRDRYGGQVRQRSFKSGFGDASQNPFYVGKLAMQVMYISEAQEISRFAPNMEYGIAPLPAPPGGEYGSSWIGGWTIAMPYGGRGHDKEAFELIRWMAHDPKGTAFLAGKMNVLPACRKSPFFDQIHGNRVLEAYYQILQNCRHKRPVSPANAFFIDELNRAVSRTIEGLLTPEQAMSEARQRTQKHLGRLMSQTLADHVK